MANLYYNHGALPVYKSVGSSSDIRAEFDAVTAGFNKLPFIGIGVANYLVTVDPSGTTLTTVINQLYLGTTLIPLGRASASQALTGILSIDGNAATVTTNANLTGEATSTGNAVTLTNASVIGKVLTGYVSGAGVLGAGDSILTAIQKLNGNISASATNLTGPITSVGPATTIASQTGTGSTFVIQTSPTLITPNIGVAFGTSLGLGGVTVARSPLHMAGGGSVYALMQSTGGVGGTTFTNTDTIPITSNNGFSGYGGLATLPNRWGNATTLDAHTAVYIGGGQRNAGAASCSLVFANWGYFTGTGVAVNELGNATAQTDAVKFKFDCVDIGSAFSQALRLVSKSASLTEQVAMVVRSDGSVYFGGPVGTDSLRILPVASSVNFMQIQGGITGTSVNMTLSGADANVGLNIYNKGLGGVRVDSGAVNSSNTFTVACTGTSGANMQFINGVTNKTIRTLNSNLEVLNGAYTAVIFSMTDTGQTSLGGTIGNESLRVLNVPSAVNFVQVSGAITANGPIIQSSGTDTDIALNHNSKGLGAQNFNAGAIGLLQLSPVTTAVNYFQMINSVTTANVTFQPVGTDANIGMNINPKGTSAITIDGGANVTPAHLIVKSASSNGARIRLTGATTSKTFVVDTSANLTILNNANTTILTLTDVGVLTLPTGGINVVGTVQHKTYTIAGLPAGVPAGTRAIVTDAASVVYGTNAINGGAGFVGVLYTGANWVYS